MGKAIITKMGTGMPNVFVGTIQDVDSGAIIAFQQAFAPLLGMAEQIKVKYQTVTTASGVIANALTLFEKGLVQTINSDNQTGTLLDKKNGNVIAFNNPFVQESGIVVGSKVDFETVDVPASGGTPAQKVAVSLAVAGS